MNFLPDSDSVSSFIETSLDTLRVECIQAYQVMCKQMGDRSVLVNISDETLVLVFHTGQIDVVGPTENPPTLSLRTNEQTILDLADGKLALLDSILNGELELKGGTTEIALVYETLITYLRGAVRCPSFPLLFDHFRDVHNRRQQSLQN